MDDIKEMMSKLKLAKLQRNCAECTEFHKRGCLVNINLLVTVMLGGGGVSEELLFLRLGHGVR